MRAVVSVVIPMRDMEDTLGAQLAALSRQDITDPFEVVVVDNGSRDRSIAVAEGWQDRLVLRVLRSPGRPDAGRARNIGVAAAVADRLVFCDADDEVRLNWLRAMVRALHVAPIVAGSLDHSRINAPEVADLYRGFDNGAPRWGFLPAGNGCNLGVRRAVFDRVRGFPEGTPGGGDTHFCWKAGLAGYSLAIEPEAVIDRRVKTTTPWTVFRLRVRRGRGVARLYKEFRHHGMPRSSLAELAYDYLSILLNLLRGRPLLAAQAAGWRVGRLIGSVRMGVFFP